MKFLTTFSSLVTAVALTPTSAMAEHYKVFVLSGQSNSLGVTNGGETDPTSGTDAADGKVLFAWHNIVGAGNSIGTSGQTLVPSTSNADFTTLKDQQGGVYNGSATHWGPEIEFSRTLYRSGVRNIAVIKASRGGGGNGFWHKPNGDHHMYTHIVDTVTQATNDLTSNGHTYEIVGFLYLQGESNLGSEAAVAGSRFKTLVDNLRTDLPNAASMHAVIGGISAAGGSRDTTRTQHAAIASSTAYIDYFSNIDQQTNLHDSIHLNRGAKITVGNRFAQAFLNADVVARKYGKTVFIGDSITQGGNGDHPSYRYQVFKNLANQGVPLDAATGYKFVGSLNGGYNNSALTTPNVNGQAFENNHDGHYGWRAFWENGRIALPTGRRGNNRGEGTIMNWTGQASPQQYSTSAGTRAFPDPTASGTGVANPYTPYTPDTAVIMIGINDIAGGSSATQVRDDIGLMIDQLQSSNANINIFISQILHTNQSFNTTVDTLNGLLPALVASKTTATSSVWVIETNTGFNPVTQTYDNIHPNDSGEAYVGNRISGGMGIIEMPMPTSTNPLPPVIEKGTLDTVFLGNEIWNNTYQNGWSVLTPAGVTESLNGAILNYDHSGSGTGTTLNGSLSSKDGGTTNWTSGNDGNWTVEVKLKCIDVSNGFVIWCGTGSNRIVIDIYGDRTQDNGNNTFNVAHNNLDGNYHTYRVAHDSSGGKYHVWRDGVRLTNVDGVAYDSAGGDQRLLFGDYTNGVFGNNFEVDIDYISYDQTGAYLPTGADADGDTIPDFWEYLYSGEVDGAEPGDDDDGDGVSNLDEYKADTDPNNKDSYLRVESVTELTAGTLTIIVPDTSPQRNYTLYRSLDMGILDPWVAVSGQGPIIGTDGDLSFTHPTTEAKYFFRVKATTP